MTSLEVSEITGKNHADVMRDIRSEIESIEKEGLEGQRIFAESSYKNSQNKEQPMYTMGREGAMQIATRYSAGIRRKLIIKLEELENKTKLPGTYKEALLALVAAEEIKEQQQLLLAEQTEYSELAKPKVEVYDAIIKTEGNYSFKYVAGLLGISKSEFVRKLKWLRIISETNEPFYEYRIAKQYFRTFFSKNWYVTPEGIIFLTKKFKTIEDNKAW